MTAIATVTRLLTDWRTTRAELAAQEAAEHPDLIDHHGRTWTWWKGDLYRHCGMAWPRSFVEDGRHGLPRHAVLTNPNYLRMGPTCDPTRISERRTP